ncbi:MAG TPA: hypothetical protein VMR86_07565 [Myxococcota bacterium]|nr:hypothetical protein [Myxococcota bacterium]
MREPVDRFSRWLPWAALGLVLLVVVAVRVRLLTVPLERDEGEYAYIGSLLLHGVPPWAEAWNMKWPGVYALYALLIGVGGPNVAAIHAGLLVASAWSALACALLARRWFGDGAAAVAGAACAAASVSPAVFGLWAHAEQFAVAAALAGLLLAQHARGRGGLAGAGLLLGAAVVVKQNAAPLALFGALGVTLTHARGRRAESLARLGAFGAGIIAMPAVTLAGLWAAGVFPRFWFWTVTYAASYGSQVSLGRGLGDLELALRRLWHDQAVWWAAAALGLAAPLWNAELRRGVGFGAALLAAGLVGASLGFYFRPQYFVLALPGLALLAGAGAQALPLRSPRAHGWACAGLAAAGLVTPIGVRSDVLVRATPDQASRAVYALNPFPEAVVLGREIAARTRPGDRIAVLGSEPEIPFYAGRRSATGYIYAYPLMEPQPYARAMQEEMVAQLEAARPEILVWVNVSTSWLMRAESPHVLLDWAASAAQSDYDAVGVADILPGGTRYVFGEAARSYQPESKYWVSVLQRRQP